MTTQEVRADPWCMCAVVICQDLPQSLCFGGLWYQFINLRSKESKVPHQVNLLVGEAVSPRAQKSCQRGSAKRTVNIQDVHPRSKWSASFHPFAGTVWGPRVTPCEQAVEHFGRILNLSTNMSTVPTIIQCQSFQFLPPSTTIFVAPKSTVCKCYSKHLPNLFRQLEWASQCAVLFTALRTFKPKQTFL